jgi:hypothetical protein
VPPDTDKRRGLSPPAPAQVRPTPLMYRPALGRLRMGVKLVWLWPYQLHTHDRRMWPKVLKGRVLPVVLRPVALDVPDMPEVPMVPVVLGPLATEWRGARQASER